jgi:hypothetical protein
MPRYECQTCGQKKDAVIQVFEVVMKYDPMADEYLPGENQAEVIIKCLDCKSDIERR